jgi:translation initiation factor eIF-2B subunit gamma
MFTADQSDPLNLHAATSSLCDVILLAGGLGTGLHPLTRTNAKPLVPLCNRPLVWFSVKPWLDAGVRHMYICAPAPVLPMLELELSACADFRGATFTFIKVNAVPQADNASVASAVSANSGTEGGTADALRSYYHYKQGLPPTDPKSAKRDALVVSCDTVFAGLNIWPFVRNFYDGFYSASAVYYEPHAVHDTSRALTDCLGVEPPCPTSTSDVMHLRTHFVTPVDHLGDGHQSLSAGIVARRVNLTLTSAFADAHVYMFRRWVLEYIDFHKDIGSVREELFPFLASRQLPLISPAEGLRMPSAKIDASKPIPIHSILKEASGHNDATNPPLSRLNAMQHVNPPSWDELRTCVSIYRSTDTARIQRVNTVAAFRSFTREVVNGMTKPETATSFALMVMPFLNFETKQTLATSGTATSDASLKYCGALSCPPASTKASCTIIGKNVEIGENVSLRHCILISGSRVAPGVKLDNVLVCAGAEVTENTESAIVSPDNERQDFN